MDAPSPCFLYRNNRSPKFFRNLKQGNVYTTGLKMEILVWKRNLFLQLVSFLLQGLEIAHLQGDIWLLSKLKGGLSLVSVEVGTGHTCIVNMLLPNNVLLHHGNTRKVHR